MDLETVWTGEIETAWVKAQQIHPQRSALALPDGVSAVMVAEGVIRCLTQRPGISIQAIADTLEVHRVPVANAVYRLLRKGRIVRSFSAHPRLSERVVWRVRA